MNKFCRTCKDTKPLEEFVKSKTGKNGTLNICKPCKSRQSREYMLLDGNYERSQKIRNYNLNNNLTTRLKHIHQTAKNRTGKNGREFAISHNDIEELWNKQEGRCALSNIPMTTVSGSSEVVSVDRIDNEYGYTTDNIQLVCSMVNLGKNRLTNNRFIEMCRAVHNRNKV